MTLLKYEFTTMICDVPEVFGNVPCDTNQQQRSTLNNQWTF